MELKIELVKRQVLCNGNLRTVGIVTEFKTILSESQVFNLLSPALQAGGHWFESSIAHHLI